MSGRDLFVVLARLAGLLALLAAASVLTLMAGLVLRRLPTLEGPPLEGVVILAAYCGLGFALVRFAPRLADRFRWPAVSARDDGPAVALTPEVWTRVTERFVGLVAVVMVVDPLRHSIAVVIDRWGESAGSVAWGAREPLIEVLLLAVTAAWLLVRSARRVAQAP